MPVGEGELKKRIWDAVEEAKRIAKPRRFDESVELIVNIRDVDLNNPANRIVETVELPNRGVEAKVCVIAEGEMALKARQGGADAVLGKADLMRLAANKKEAKKVAKQFDFFVAQADFMPIIARNLGPILGPRDKMPVPLPPTADPTPLIKRLKNSVRIKMKKQPLVQVYVGKRSMKTEDIVANIMTVLSFLKEKLERGFGNIKSIYVKTTMGKPVKVPLD